MDDPPAHPPFSGLTPAQAAAYYDRYGARQDRPGRYAAVALKDLIRHARFDQAGAVVEFGCGTGKLAAQLLSTHLPPAATYWGCDISATMLALTEQRLRAFAERATTWQSAGDARLPMAEASADRFVSTYVLDILPDAGITAVLAEARRLLKPEGLLCLTSLTHGASRFSRLVMAGWRLRFALNPALVGGCRPMVLRDRLAADWEITHRRVVAGWGISSEVIVARRRPSE